jgi:hypothetical protein
MTMNQLAALELMRACRICKEQTREPVRETPNGLFCARHTFCEGCNCVVLSDSVEVVCDTPSCYASGHERCLRVYFTKDAPDCFSCQPCKRFWQLREFGRICTVCHQPFCSAHMKKCISCTNVFYQGSVTCESAQQRINGACSEWCLDAAIARVQCDEELRYELTYAAQAFLPRYTQMAFALAELNWPVLVTMAILDLCVPPILFSKTSMHQRWEVLKAINRRWRAKNGCGVESGALVSPPEKKTKMNWASGEE